ncbi:MAG TPA: SMI1/KNR4 family protein [Chryseosolibacter sp.]
MEKGVSNAFDDQLERIREKLIRAKQFDGQFKTFGSASHRYVLHDPATEEALRTFESTYNIKLPPCYRAFVSTLGNGGVSYMKSGAGPYFGIFPLGEQIDFLVKKPEKYLSNICLLHPDMTDQWWNELVYRINFDDTLSDDDYDDEVGKVFGGLMLIGTQGCTYFHALILNGSYAGRVVKVDITLEKPTVSAHSNFLHWYEGWLDDILSGHLLQNKAMWLGYRD